MMRKLTPIYERLRFRLRLDSKTGCLVWTGATTNFGHGLIGNGRRGTGVSRTHRVTYQHIRGPIPFGLFVLHKCDNPPCCNPDHLFLGTQADNMRDMSKKGRGSTPAAKLSHDQVRAIRFARVGGESTKDIAARFGINPRQVRKIVSRKQWRRVD